MGMASRDMKSFSDGGAVRASITGRDACPTIFFQGTSAMNLLGDATAMSYVTITIEGGLIPDDLLERIAEGPLPGNAPPTSGLAPLGCPTRSRPRSPTRNPTGLPSNIAMNAR